MACPQQALDKAQSLGLAFALLQHGSTYHVKKGTA